MMRPTLAVLTWNAALGTEAPALEKVVTMLEDLKAEVSKVGEEEAKTYEKFACFCKDTTAEKVKSIEDAETEKDSLQARLNDDISKRGEEDDGIKEKSDDIDENSKKLEKLKEDHKEAVIKFEKEEFDLSSALMALDGAIQTMHASRSAVSLSQLKPVAQTVSRAIIMADVLGLSPTRHGKKIVSMLMTGEIPDSVYDFSGGDIINTLEGLRGDFRDEKNELLKTHTADKQAFEKEKQDLEQQIETDERGVETHKKNKAEAVSRIATASQDLSAVSAQLLDDQSYLAELNKNCGDKATLWDERSQTRANELQAITKALEIIKSETVQGDDEASADAAKFVQLTSAHNHRHLRTQSLQISRHAHSHRSSPLTGRRAQVVALLRSKASEMKSASLMRLADSAADDPFGKVRKLIEELIERLLQQAADEANHKGWCDKEMSAATQQRDKQSQLIKELNSKLAIGEGRIGKLEEQIKKTKATLEKLEKTVEEADALRDKEKEENEKTIKEAKEASEAVADAIKILDEFYKTAAKNKAAFVQRAAQPDAPDAGFDEAYTGNQGGGSGVIGMLEVVKSDFDRTVKETEKEEAAAKDAHMDFKTQTGKSQAENKVAEEEYEGALNDAEAEHSENKEGLKSAVDSLSEAIGELLSLHKACVDTGMTVEERNAARAEELAALKQALCILQAQGPAEAGNC